MQQLKPWIDSFDVPELNAGVSNKCAMDAWYKTSLLIEQALIQKLKIAGVSVDVLKCFDQINREVVRKICYKAGMPARVLEAYFKYIESMTI